MNSELLKTIQYHKIQYSAMNQLIKKMYLSMFVFSLSSIQLSAKSYPFDMNHPYEVQIVRVAEQGTKFLKVYGIAGSVDKAIDRAMQDAVAACIFKGVPENDVSGKIAPLCEGDDAYESNKKYFDSFFKRGEFMNYVNPTLTL